MKVAVRTTLFLKAGRTVERYFGDDNRIPSVFLRRAGEQSEVI